MKLQFTKVVATGNDFILIDEIERTLVAEEKKSSLARRLCNRRLGIGADGLIFISKPSTKDADIHMRIFNSDGSEAEFCGNAARCVTKYIVEKKLVKSPNVRIKTLAGIYKTQAILKGRKVFSVKVNLGEPKLKRKDIPMTGNPNDFFIDKTSKTVALNIGVPHCVLFVDDVDETEVETKGRDIRYNFNIFPKGTNVNFAQINNGKVKVRTYERGVEAETLSCGTGVAASAIATSLMGYVKTKDLIEVITRGGKLKVYIKKEAEKIKRVFLEGSAKISFTGEIII